MLSKKVLIISYYFPPMGLSGVQRTLKFVKYLPEYDWIPVVLTTNSGSYYAYDETLIEDLKNIAVHRTEKDALFFRNNKNKPNKLLKYPSHLSQKIKRIISQTFLQPDSRITWKKYAVKLGREILSSGDFNAIYATAPPFTDFLVAKQLAEEFNLSFIVDYRDLWVDNAYYYYATPFHKNYAISLEYEVVKKANKILVTSRNLKESLLQRYKFLNHNDISIIPHGFDAEDFREVRGITKATEKFVITHSGLFPDDLTPKYFLKAVSELFTEKPELRKHLELKFVGLMRQSHLNLISKYKLIDVTNLVGYVSHKDSIREILSSDILWLMIPNNIVTPSRLFEYIGSLKPFIISAPNGNMKQYSLDTNVAIATDVKDIKEIKNAILHYYELWQKNTLPKGNQEYANKFERKYLTSYLAKEIALIGKFNY